MATSYGSVNAICPFYQSDDAQVIRCEGIVSSTINKCRFPSRELKDRYKIKHCDLDYQTCSIYMAIMTNYEEVK